MPVLESALNHISATDILRLPVGHLTTVENFIQILTDNAIRPMNDEHSYFSYGQVSYIKNGGDLRKCPVGLIFSPDIATLFNLYYPFDEGAFELNLFGMQSRLSRLAEYEVDPGRISNTHQHIPNILVSALYEKPINYIKKHVTIHPGVKCQPALESLIKFLHQPERRQRVRENDLASHKYHVDRRSHTIECLTRRDVSLTSYLRGIIYPLEARSLFKFDTENNSLFQNLHYTEHFLFHRFTKLPTIENGMGACHFLKRKFKLEIGH